MDASSRNRRLLAVFLAGAAALIGGCSTNAPSAGSTTTKSPSVSPSRSATPTPSATPVAAAAAGTCASTALSVLLGSATAVARSHNYPIEFINISGTPCTLHGFPSVSLAAGSSYSPVGPAATSNRGSGDHLITIPPEGTATALLVVENAKDLSGSCRQTTVTTILIDPPGLRHTVRIPFSGLACANPRYHVMTVDAVRIGTPVDSDGE
jgi:hypothetical protein